MGSSFSIQSKEKRRRSNRLSKPPQNQASSNCPSSRLSIRPAEQALSLPSTPTAWQNPWTGIPVPVNPSEVTVSPGVRSQSFSSGRLRRGTWNCNALHATQGEAQGRTDSWPPSPTSPTSAPSRRGSLYRRASFHPSKPATFQPTTLQSTPQSPLIGQPKRSYSVHSPAQGPMKNAPRRTLDRFASLNSYSSANGQDILPIRRRSLLVRPGVATRKATKIKSHTLVSEPYQSDNLLHGHHGVLTYSAQPPFPVQRVDPKNFEPLSELRPSTPNDVGYTHLGTLKLGSLRVVNGSVSPCPSDRTRLEQPTSATPESMLDCLNHTSSLAATTENQVSGATLGNFPKAHDGIETLNSDTNTLPDLMSSLSPKGVPYAQGLPRRPTISARHEIPTTMLNISLPVPINEVEDFPASPFSFEKSPTSAISHGLEHRGCEDEGISIHDNDRVFSSPSAKVPERHLSYSSYASSHRKADSGYSSATSHRTSIDSHASLRRSPGFRRFTFGGRSKDFEAHDKSTTTQVSKNASMHRHLSLHNQKANDKPDLRTRPTSMSAVYHEPQLAAIERPRTSSTTCTGTTFHALSLPMYCVQLRNLESAAPDFCLPITQNIKPTESAHTRSGTESRGSSTGKYHSKADYAGSSVLPSRFVRDSRGHSYSTAYRARSEDAHSQRCQTHVPGGHDLQYIDTYDLEPRLPMSRNEFTSLAVGQVGHPDMPRGRTLRRSSEYPPSEHQPPTLPQIQT
ncbi:hypothetical protein BJX64DRAFT_241893 [Aspergillus heterothallicus]